MNLISRVSLIIYLKHIKHERQIRKIWTYSSFK